MLSDGMSQLTLPFSHTRESFSRLIEQNTRMPIRLTVHDNSVSLLSVRNTGEGLAVRMHWMFLHSDDIVTQELCEFVRRKGGRTPLINQFIMKHRHLLKKAGPRKERVCTRGKYHDLLELFDVLNQQYFGGKNSSRIRWGRKTRTYRIRNRTLGSYSADHDMIRINPLLDSSNVPKYFVKFVIYHEMLHSDMMKEEKNLRPLHNAEFRKRERLFDDYERAVSWERQWACHA
jgi:hypothetical protein